MSGVDDLTEQELEDLWNEIDSDSAKGMDNDQYAGDGIESPIPQKGAHSRRSRQMSTNYDEMNYDDEDARWD